MVSNEGMGNGGLGSQGVVARVERTRTGAKTDGGKLWTVLTIFLPYFLMPIRDRRNKGKSMQRKKRIREGDWCRENNVQ